MVPPVLASERWIPMTGKARMLATTLVTLLRFATGSALMMGHFFAVVSTGIVVGLIARSRVRWPSRRQLKQASSPDAWEDAIVCHDQQAGSAQGIRARTVLMRTVSCRS